MSSSKDNNTTNPERLVYETRKEAKEIRQIATRQLMRYGQLNAGTHLDLAEVVIEYEQTLREFDDDPVVDDSDYPNIEPLKQAAGRQTERTVTTSGQWVGSVHTERQPMVLNFPADQLIRVINELDHLARELGFSAETADETRPLYDAGKRETYPNPVDDDIPKPKMGGGGGDGPLDLRYSKLYHDWYQRVACGDPNDYVIAISADPRSTGVSGSGKTTFGGGLAKRWLDYSEGGFNADVQYTLDPAKLAYDLYEDTGELAVLLGDEMQGTPATTGLNAKRSQKSEALDTINAIAAGRSDRKTVILIVQDLKSLNKDALTFIDAWLLIRDDFDYVATHYSVAPDVFDLGSRETKTPGVEQITWDALPNDDEDYQVMEEKKEAAKRGEREYSDDDGEEQAMSPKERRNKKIKDLYQSGVSQSKIADAYELTQPMVSDIVNGNL